MRSKNTGELRKSGGDSSATSHCVKDELEVCDNFPAISRTERPPDGNVDAVAGESHGTICHLQMHTADMLAARWHRCSEGGKETTRTRVGAIHVQVTMLTMGPRRAHEQGELTGRTVDVQRGTKRHGIGLCRRLSRAEEDIRDGVNIGKITVSEATFTECRRITGAVCNVPDSDATLIVHHAILLLKTRIWSSGAEPDDSASLIDHIIRRATDAARIFLRIGGTA